MIMDLKLQILYEYWEKTKVALVPPNPKLFDKATFTSLSWAWSGTRLNLGSMSGLCRFNVGGMVF